jgi:hypothetical protein
MIDQLRVSLLCGPRSEPFGDRHLAVNPKLLRLTSLIAPHPPALTRSKSILQGQLFLHLEQTLKMKSLDTYSSNLVIIFIEQRQVI